MRRKIIIILFALVIASLKPSGFVHATSIWPLSLELATPPGSTTIGTVQLTNNSASSTNYLLSIRDFSASTDESGTPVFADVNQVSTHSLANWIDLGETTLSMAPGESREVHFTVSVPTNTRPGGYYTALLFGENDSTASVPVNTQVGALIFLNVTGNAVTEGRLSRFNAPYIVSHLPELLSAHVENTGQTVLTPTGSIVITNLFGKVSANLAVNPHRTHVLQGSTRQMDTLWQKTELSSETPEIVREWKNFGFGYYRATLALELGDGTQTINAETGFWVLPSQMIILACVLILIILLVAKRAHKRKR